MNQDDPTRPRPSEIASGNVAIEIEPDETPVGQGRVVDAEAMLGGRNAWAEASNGAPM